VGSPSDTPEQLGHNGGPTQPVTDLNSVNIGRLLHNPESFFDGCPAYSDIWLPGATPYHILGN